MYRKRFCHVNKCLCFFFLLKTFFFFFPFSFYTLIKLCKGGTHKDDDTQIRVLLFHKAKFIRMKTFKGKFCNLWIQWQPKGTLNLFFPSSLPSPFIYFFAFAFLSPLPSSSSPLLSIHGFFSFIVMNFCSMSWTSCNAASWLFF